ncbi:MAG: glycosyltransferase family 4 protein [Pseudomonadota bacterium]
MKIAMLSPIAWRTPPVHYGPWERYVSLLTNALLKNNIDVTLFATKESQTAGKLHAIAQKGYEEDSTIDPKVWECLHISEVFEKAKEFDLIHNSFDFLPLSYSSLVATPVVTTIHGFSSEKILPVYKKYNKNTYYIAISNSDRSPQLDYIDTIYHGIDIENFTFNENHQKDYLLFFGRIHPDKGTKEAIEIANKVNMKLIIAGIIQDENYFKNYIKPHFTNSSVEYIGSVGNEKRNAILKNAYALLHPINFNEPFGFSIVEAMACGTPTIAFNKGSMPELITDGHDGFLVNTVSEACEAVNKIETIDRINCRKTVENRFTTDIMVNKYINVYEKIIKNHKKQ